MIYREKIPHSALREYVQLLWYCQANELTHKVHTIPLLHHELVIDVAANKTWISGLQTRPVVTSSSGRHEMLGVLFKPAGLRAFMKHGSGDFADLHIDASLVFGSSVEVDTLSALEEFLLNRLHPIDCPIYFTRCLKLFSVEQKISVREICKEIYTSNKSLINSFHKYVGVSPRKYLQLQSVNAAISMLSKNPGQSFTKLAYHLNFYDQSHFIHSFKSVTGLSPTAYARAVMNKKVDAQSPNFIFLEG